MARKEVEDARKATTQSVTLRPAEWTFLNALAEHLRAERFGDPLGVRATVSQAVRHLIEEAQKAWPRDGQGRLVFKVAPDVDRTFDPATGTTAVSPSASPSPAAPDAEDEDDLPAAPVRLPAARRAARFRVGAGVSPSPSHSPHAKKK